MQLDVKLQEPFSYSVLGLILLILLLIALLTYIIIIIIKKQSNKPKIIIEKRVDINSLKKKYINQINKLLIEVNNKKIKNRSSYNELSSIIRKFVYEATNIDVTKYSLNEIRKLKYDSLTKLVEEYYEPEFSYSKEGDILASIEKTKGVIETWK